MKSRGVFVLDPKATSHMAYQRSIMAGQELITGENIFTISQKVSILLRRYLSPLYVIKPSAILKLFVLN